MTESPEPATDQNVELSTVHIQVRAFRVTISIRSNFWYHWTRIAIEHRAEAQEERARTIVGKDTDDAQAMGRELRAAMVAVTAPAFAIEALYAELRRISPTPELDAEWEAAKRRPSAVKRILQVLRAALDWPPPMDNRLEEDVRWLFPLRGQAVHFVSADRAAVPHPAGTSTAQENVDYSLESADRAASFVLDLLELAVTPGAQRTEELQSRAAANRHAVVELRDLYDAGAPK